MYYFIATRADLLLPNVRKGQPGIFKLRLSKGLYAFKSGVESAKLGQDIKKILGRRKYLLFSVGSPAPENAFSIDAWARRHESFALQERNNWLVRNRPAKVTPQKKITDDLRTSLVLIRNDQFGKVSAAAESQQILDVIEEIPAPTAPSNVVCLRDYQYPETAPALSL